MKKIIKYSFLLVLVLIINSSCKDYWFGTKCEQYKDVYSYEFDTVFPLKRFIEVLHVIVTKSNSSGVKPTSRYNNFEVYRGFFIINYNPKKELLFIRNSDGGTDWPNVYPNVTIEMLKNFKIPDDFEDNGTYFGELVDINFKRETNYTKIKEARTFLNTNFCKQ